MISSSKMAASIRLTLRDNFAASGQTYADPEIVDAINRSIKYCGALAWAMTVKVAQHPLVSGFVQTLPNSAARLNNVFGNALDVSVGELIGLRQYHGQSPVQQVTVDFINTQLRNAGATAKQIVTMYAQHPETPSAFLVYPPNDGTGKLHVSYRTELPEITVLGSNDIDVSNLFEGAIIAYALFALLTRDGNDSPLATDGAIYLKLCSEQLMALQPAAQAQPAKE